MTGDARTETLLPTTRVWAIDPLHSSVRFAVTHHVIATYRAGFADFEGTYDADSETLRGSVKVDSAQVAFTALHKELMSEVFFDAERYPTISFTSSAITVAGDSIAIDGELTMKGTTRSVRAVGTVNGTSLVNQYDGTAHEHFGMELEMTIDRRDFGVDHNNELLDGRVNLGWEVQIQFSLEFSTYAGTVDKSGQFVPAAVAAQ